MFKGRHPLPLLATESSWHLWSESPLSLRSDLFCHKHDHAESKSQPPAGVLHRVAASFMGVEASSWSEEICAAWRFMHDANRTTERVYSCSDFGITPRSTRKTARTVHAALNCKSCAGPNMSNRSQAKILRLGAKFSLRVVHPKMFNSIGANPHRGTLCVKQNWC